jgi:hypothetical protein
VTWLSINSQSQTPLIAKIWGLRLSDYLAGRQVVDDLRSDGKGQEMFTPSGY